MTIINITLADVLLACSFNLMTDYEKFVNILTCQNGFYNGLQGKSSWDLTKDLDGQSEETIKFLCEIFEV